jgi:hypothetical protein
MVVEPVETVPDSDPGVRQDGEIVVELVETPPDEIDHVQGVASG